MEENQSRILTEERSNIPTPKLKGKKTSSKGKSPQKKKKILIGRGRSAAPLTLKNQEDP